MQEIIKLYKQKKLHRNIDEKGAEGLWDLAGEVTYNTKHFYEQEEAQEILYNLFQELMDEIVERI